MGSVGFVYPTSLNVGTTVRKHSWSMQSDIVVSRSHVRWCGRFKFEEEEDEGEDSSTGEYGGGKLRPIVWSLGGNSMDDSASAKEGVAWVSCCWLLGLWLWLQLRAKGSRRCSMQSHMTIELEEGLRVRGSRVLSAKSCVCSFAAAISWVLVIAAGEAPHDPEQICRML